MKKHNLRVISFCLLIAVIFIGGCILQQDIYGEKNPVQGIDPQQAFCENLVAKLDEQTVDTNNPPGRLIISALGENVSEVGGFLINITVNQDFSDYKYYTLSFSGNNAAPGGELCLLTKSNESLPYVLGKFYRFDLTNINIFSAATSGMFIDNELNKIILTDCDYMKN